MWNSSHITAWDRNKEGLVRASIEVKDMASKQTFVRAECDGHDFRVFQWLAIAKVNPNFKGSISPTPVNIGLKMLTTRKVVTVLYDGTVDVRDITKDELDVNFATFGR